MTRASHIDAARENLLTVSATPRNVFAFALAGAIAVVSSCPGRAIAAQPANGGRQSLTIDLPAPRPAAATPIRYSDPSDAGAQLSPPDFSHITVQAIGVINTDGAQIVRRVGGAGIKVLYTCSAGQNLGVAGQMGDWLCVVMADNSLGCVLADRVNLTWQRPAASSDLTLDTRPAPLPTQGGFQPGPQPGEIGTLPPSGFSHTESMSPTAARVIDDARQYLGVPYRWGGNTASGIDCSGLVKAVFGREGIDLPRTAREQADAGTAVQIQDIQPGDRLSFMCKGATVDHTGIYVGNGEFIHASGARSQVCISRIDGYLRWLVAIRRDAR